MGSAASCDNDQTLVLPVFAALALVAAFLAAIHAAGQTTSRRWQPQLQDRISRSLELLDKVEGGTDLESPVAPHAKAVAKTLKEALTSHRVLIFDLIEYQMARSRLQLISTMLSGCCLAALAAAGGANLLFGVCRVVLVGMLWVHHESYMAALRGRAMALPEGLRSVSRAVGGQDTSGLDAELQNWVSSALDCLTHLSTAKIQMLRLLHFATHIGLLALVVTFEVFRHPTLMKACKDDQPINLFDNVALLAERAAAITMILAWILSAFAYASVLKCEACIWIAPEAQVQLTSVLQIKNGCLPTGCGVELAEALCGSAGEKVMDALLRELLNGFGVAVINDSAVLHPLPANGGKGTMPPPQALAATQVPQLTQKDLADLQKDLRAEFRRSLDGSELRLSEAMKATQETLAKKHDALSKAVVRDTMPASSSRRPSWRTRPSSAQALEPELPAEAETEAPHKPSRQRLGIEKDAGDQALLRPMPGSRTGAENDSEGHILSRPVPRPRLPPENDAEEHMFARPPRPRVNLDMDIDNEGLAGTMPQAGRSRDPEAQEQEQFRPAPRPKPNNEMGGARRPSRRPPPADKPTHAAEPPDAAERRATLEASLDDKAIPRNNSAEAVEKTREPRRASRIPPRRRAMAAELPTGAGVGSMEPMSQVVGAATANEFGASAETPAEFFDDDEFGVPSNSRASLARNMGAPGAQKAPPTVRTVPPPSHQRRSLSSRSGARAERPSRLSRTPPESFVSRLGPEDGLDFPGEEGMSGVTLAADLHDNHAWPVNAF